MRRMDDLLKRLATVSEAVAAAEAELADGSAGAATDHLDAADRGLAELRSRWPELPSRERRLLGAAAAPVRGRLDAARARVPRRAALSQAPAVVDPEQEVEPEAAPAG
jgi:hypothetical protein